MQWQDIKQNMKNQIIENKPIAKIDNEGNITLDVSDEFYNILDNFCDEGKAKVKKAAFQVAMLTALGIGGAAVAIGIDPQTTSNIIATAHAFTLCSGFYILNAWNKKKEAEYYYEHLEENFKKEAEERIQNGQYYIIRDDGVIEFDSPTNKIENSNHKIK